ncbi:hypothetical protein G6L99_09125 [Agrobacterium rhizogenes]|uniref:hypothetical protein n=1 Tax=Rhizobium rhizogenes TaxID=359 RepID=UPI0015737156|nr:hypothetical protein [Rhizobium rhizogenes]NTH12271.1 hypothetical protein [Rhizobium rhizogenes]
MIEFEFAKNSDKQKALNALREAIARDEDGGPEALHLVRLINPSWDERELGVKSKMVVDQVRKEQNK